jgi:hypothetical protein
MTLDTEPHPDAERLSIRDDLRASGACVYSGFDFPEADALIDALEDRGLRVVRQ